MTRFRLAHGCLALGSVALLAACGDNDSAASDDRPTVVVTYSVLGALVTDLVGDAATVRVIIPNGVDPHDFAPSARDIEAVGQAAFVVSNGLDLEEGMVEALEQAEAAGTPVFHVTDHVVLRESGDDDHAHEDEDEHADEAEDHADEDQEHGAYDPHVWTDPLTMSSMLPALAEQLSSVLGVDLDESLADVQQSLAELDAEIDTQMSALDECHLVTGHESLGYFADRYGCELIGAIIPSLSTSAEASARQLAELRALVEAEGVPVIFTELGTPPQLAEQLASEAGVDVVELATHVLPDSGEYSDFVRALADGIVTGFAGSSAP